MELSHYRDDADSLLEFLAVAKVKGNQKYLAKMLTWAADLVHKWDKETFSKTLDTYTRRYTLDWDLKPGPTPVEFDDHLYDLASKVWPYIAPLYDFTDFRSHPLTEWSHRMRCHGQTF